MLMLSADGLPSLDLDDLTQGFVCEEWGIGPPAVRQVVENRTEANGTLDWTRYSGSRAVTFRIIAFANPVLGLSVQGQLDRLAAYCRPDLRPTLTWTFPGDDERMIIMRANPGLDVPYASNAYAAVRCGLSFVVPDALVWSAIESSVAIVAADPNEDGRSYNERESMTVGIPQNLMPSDAQASVETGTTTPAANLGTGTWSRWGGDQFVARDPAVARIGTSSLVMTRVTAGAAQGTPTATNSTVLNRFPITPLHVYQVLFSCFVEAAAADKRIQVSGDIRDATPASIGAWARIQTAVGGAWEDRATSFVTWPGAVDSYMLFTAWPEATTGKTWIDRVALYDLGPLTWKLPSESDGSNLLTDQQADIEAGPSTPTWNTFPGWRGNSAAVMLSRATDRLYSGQSCLMAARVGTPATVRIWLADDTGALARIPVTAGQRYVFASWIQRSGMSAAQNHNIGTAFYDAATGGTLIADTIHTELIPLAGNDTWWPLYAEVLAPAGATHVQLYYDFGTVVEGTPAYVDTVSFGPAPAMLPFYLPSEYAAATPTGVWGRGYDRIYPHTDPPHVEVVNAGQVSVPWRAVIYGPCTNPRLVNDTTGEGLYFTAGGGLSLLADETLVLDSMSRTATVDGASRYSKLDIANSRWFSLAPGANAIRFNPDTASASTVCDFMWRSAWL